MASPTIGFSVSEADRARLARLTGRYAHGNRSQWLRQALDLFEQKELFDALAGVQAGGDRQTAERGLDRETLEQAVATTLTSPSRAVVEWAEGLIVELAGSEPGPVKGSVPDALEEFLTDHEPPG